MSLNPLSWFRSASTAIQADVAAAPAKTVSLIHAGLAAIEKHEAGHPALLAFTEYLDTLATKYGAGIVQEVDQAVLSAVVAEVPGASSVLSPLINHPSSIVLPPKAMTPAVVVVAAAPVPTK